MYTNRNLIAVEIIITMSVLLAIYYCIIIIIDLYNDYCLCKAESDNNGESEIDISDIATSFKPVEIRRNDYREPKALDNINNIETDSNVQDPQIKKCRQMTDSIEVEKLIGNIQTLDHHNNPELFEFVMECRSVA